MKKIDNYLHVDVPWYESSITKPKYIYNFDCISQTPYGNFDDVHYTFNINRKYICNKTTMLFNLDNF